MDTCIGFIDDTPKQNCQSTNYCISEYWRSGERGEYDNVIHSCASSQDEIMGFKGLFPKFDISLCYSGCLHF